MAMENPEYNELLVGKPAKNGQVSLAMFDSGTLIPSGRASFHLFRLQNSFLLPLALCNRYISALRKTFCNPLFPFPIRRCSLGCMYN